MIARNIYRYRNTLYVERLFEAHAVNYWANYLRKHIAAIVRQEGRKHANQWRSLYVATRG
jgi:hypothetical protein